ncbi:metallophosphoesterase [Halococcoides cellulosivorans]|uniref:metallophosphoesterase n=1 Tax=Halococcoides cellulosivorans TaxID=1679096 RepID=UPI001F1B4AFE|nr:metallophosphoesterase [Halococcoides cellulosivorans]
MPTITHFADTHLGHRQYGLKQRADDMLSTTRTTIDAMLADDPDAIVLPGDLFHSRDLRPKVLHRIERDLDRIPDSVPVLVSRGNHDENLTPREVTWLNYLHERGQIVFLRAHLDPDATTFEPYDPAGPGQDAGFYDVEAGLDGPIRVFGLQYRGAKTARALDAAADGIRATNAAHGDPAMVVLLAHFGIEEEVPSLGGSISHTDLDPVREVVDYLALGHIHKRYESGDWIYNPGSPEAHSTREGSDDWDHGYYRVSIPGDGDGASDSDGAIDGQAEVDGDPSSAFAVEHVPTKRRPYYRIVIDVTPHDSAGALTSAVHDQVRAEQSAIDAHCSQDRFTARGDPRAPIVDLRFTGTLQFERGAFRPDELADWVEDSVGALYVQVNTGIRTASVQELVADIDEPVFEDGRLNTDALERRVFETIARESPYDDHADAVADVLDSAHRMAQVDEAPDDVRDAVSAARRELFPDRADEVVLDIEEDPFDDGDAAGESADDSVVPTAATGGQGPDTGDETDSVAVDDPATGDDGPGDESDPSASDESRDGDDADAAQTTTDDPPGAAENTGESEDAGPTLTDYTEADR